MYNQRAMIPQPDMNRTTDQSQKEDFSQMNPAGGSQYSNYDRGFDDVASIKTEQFKLSARDHNLLENHLFSQSQSRESLPMMSPANQYLNDIPTSSVDGEIKERMLAQLGLENKNLREEITNSKGKVFQLESDLDYLRTTIEKNLPFFNKLE